MAGGTLKEHEKKFIRENCLEQSDKILAETLQRDKRTVASYRKSLGVKKGRGGKIVQTENILEDTGTTNNDISIVGASNNKERYKLELKQSKYYEVLKSTFSDDELEYYTEAWADLSEQFSDIIQTERRQIDDLIRAEIMGNRMLMKIKLVNDEIEEIAGEVDRLRQNNDMDNDEVMQERDEYLLNLIAKLSGWSQAMSNDYQKNVDLKRRIIEDLSARRKDRAKQLENVGSTFLSLVTAYKDRQVRMTQGRHIELLRMSASKKQGEWRKSTVFPDGSKDCILLDEESEILDKAKNIITEHTSVDLLDSPQDLDKKEVEKNAEIS